jgi:hypothetical protein
MFCSKYLSYDFLDLVPRVVALLSMKIHLIVIRSDFLFLFQATGRPRCEFDVIVVLGRTSMTICTREDTQAIQLILSTHDMPFFPIHFT